MLTSWLRRSVPRAIRRGSALALIMLSLLAARPCHAWGQSGHKLASGLAIDCLPADLKPLFDVNRAWIVRHSVDPDEWRRTNFAVEAPRHYIDLDGAGAGAVNTFPEEYWVAVGTYGREAVERNGTLPWRIGELYGKLVRAYRSRDARAIVEMATWLGHYAADAHVPFHATVQYDGPTAAQKGIHTRFESGLVDQRIKPDDLSARAAAEIKSPVGAAFEWARASLPFCPAIVEADAAAVRLDADYGYNYYAEFARTARPIAIKRLNESGRDIASLWLSAWIAAGRPPLPAPVSAHAESASDRPAPDPDTAAPTASQARP
ncbi:MAG TPA: hypothetical protein VKT77_20675 [Chthonomonadaceae bacterium]|nr:hypothetical protein [Chthonomonadaceae bacterium]